MPIYFISILFLALFSGCSSQSQKHQELESKVDYGESDLLTNSKQLVFEGKRAGEGYFSADGKFMIYQAEINEDNPFYQIYVMDMQNGDSWQVSPGHGKTTCAWIHPSNKKVLFSSTHQDKSARSKQREELKFRSSGKKRRYSWDYDENFEIYSTSLKKSKTYKRLTRAKGYDAEGSYSPDGKWIAFSSNRHAYTKKMSKEDRAIFSRDPSYMLDIYIMKSDGSSVKRLTSHKGYDGGPFFSPDGQRIIWRRFSANGHTAEVYTMKLDGSDQRQLTHLNAMSWAPFYHPSGDYAIFTTNVHGYSNFELYIVDRSGTNPAKRVTFTDGFDGLPVFTPDGNKLAWTRKGANSAHIYMADWNDKMARKILGLAPAAPIAKTLSPEIDKNELEGFVRYFSSREMKGRMTGSAEEKVYTEKVASYFKEFGLVPIKGQKSFVIPFDFEAGGKLDSATMTIEGSGKSMLLSDDFTPLSMSKSGKFDFADVAFVGYGLRVPEGEGFAAYDSFGKTDLKDKWVLMFRFLPESLEGKKRLYYQRYARLQFKIKTAMELGARGVIFVSGPNSKVKKQLIPWAKQQSLMQLPVISITDDVAQAFFLKSLGAIQSKLDSGEKFSSKMKSLKVAAEVKITQQRMRGHNVIGLLKVARAKTGIMIGAHGDHLGEGIAGASFKNSKDVETIHFGADDNASGMAAVMELAHYFSKHRSRLKKNIYFSIWSGEEIGLLGSKAFIKTDLARNKIQAYLNMDMIGRIGQNGEILIQGTGSSKRWPKLLQKAAWKSELKIKLESDPYLPTDSTTFYLQKIPGISMFSGTHTDYHSPRDTADNINYLGIEKASNIIANLAKNIDSTAKIEYHSVERKGHGNNRRNFRIYLGTLPDYSSEGVVGLKLSGVIKGGPAEKGGLMKDDVIVEFAGKPVKNIYDYMYVLEMAKPGQQLKVTVVRQGQKKNLIVIPESKQ